MQLYNDYLQKASDIEQNYENGVYGIVTPDWYNEARSIADNAKNQAYASYTELLRNLYAQRNSDTIITSKGCS